MTQQEGGLSIRIENVDDECGGVETDLKRMLSLAATSSSDFSDGIKSSANMTRHHAIGESQALLASDRTMSKPGLLNPNRDEANQSKMALPFSADESRQLTPSNQSTFYDQLLGLTRSSSFVNQKKMQFEPRDVEFLKKTRLFAEWSDDEVLKFIEEDRIRLKKSK